MEREFISKTHTSHDSLFFYQMLFVLSTFVSDLMHFKLQMSFKRSFIGSTLIELTQSFNLHFSSSLVFQGLSVPAASNVTEDPDDDFDEDDDSGEGECTTKVHRSLKVSQWFTLQLMMMVVFIKTLEIIHHLTALETKNKQPYSVIFHDLSKKLTNN